MEYYFIDLIEAIQEAVCDNTYPCPCHDAIKELELLDILETV